VLTADRNWLGRGAPAGTIRFLRRAAFFRPPLTLCRNTAEIYDCTGFFAGGSCILMF
jgi:hypothetical protein